MFSHWRELLGTYISSRRQSELVRNGDILPYQNHTAPLVTWKIYTHSLLRPQRAQSWNMPRGTSDSTEAYFDPPEKYLKPAARSDCYGLLSSGMLEHDKM